MYRLISVFDVSTFVLAYFPHMHAHRGQQEGGRSIALALYKNINSNMALNSLRGQELAVHFAVCCPEKAAELV